jgi:group I intron endonuclease
MSDKYNLKSKLKNIPSTSGVYCILNNTNNKRYVGFSKNIFSRLKEHIGGLYRECDKRAARIMHCDQMINDWRTSDSSFSFLVLEITEDRSREVYWTNYYQSSNETYGYNIYIGGIPTEEVRLLRSDVMSKYHENHKLKIRGSKNPNSKLTENEINDIKSLLSKGASVKSISQQFKVCLNTVYAIRNGDTWNH